MSTAESVIRVRNGFMTDNGMSLKFSIDGVSLMVVAL